MNSVWILAAALILYVFGYRLYGKLLSRTFDVDAKRVTPAHSLKDGVDFVPAKNWLVLFGHHFSSICGAGPIIGPVLACAYWGWGVSFVWIIAGALLMGAVSDFSSLVMSVRSSGQSIAQIAGAEISRRTRLYFSFFLLISLILVIAVFSIFAAKTFIAEPDAVIPSVGLIPTAVFVGWLLYVRKASGAVSTVAGLAILCFLLYAGQRLPVSLPAAGFLNAEMLWIVLLLIYCFVASVTPVQILLQPRDYLASYILFALIGVGVVSVLVTHPVINAPASTAFVPSAWPKAGPLWPMLFVTIACGAISGFHSLVSTGTTCKQLDTEAHACRIGYGGMLVESLVGVLVLIAVSAGLKYSELGSHLKAGGPIDAFSHGFGSISSVFLGDYGISFAVLALNAFILTTLDTATRITRYITSEVFGIRNKYLSTFLVVGASALLAVSGRWNLLWPAFGASNQLIAGVTLMTASCWLLNRGKSFWMTLVPSLLMLLTTIAAFFYQFLQSLFRHDPASGAVSPDWLMVVLTLLLIAFAFSIFWEAFLILRLRKSRCGTFGNGTRLW